jgi:hypothetical protein
MNASKKKVLLGAFSATLLVAAPAYAATTIGTTAFEQPGVSACQNRLSIGLESAHKSTATGVVTAFTVNPSVNRGSVALKVTNYNPSTKVVKILGSSPLGKIHAEGLQTFKTRVRIKVGNNIGVWGTGTFACESQTADAIGLSAYLTTPNPNPGFTAVVSGEVSHQRTLVSAKVEPDADNDGFGDETQDGCKGETGHSNGCIVSTCHVPQLKGKLRIRARSALKVGNCRLGRVKFKRLDHLAKKKRNRVRSQLIAAGKFVHGGKKVGITINVKKKST